ncbi:MAG: hypothetical protein LUH51_05875, partial [Firmicutes bacterium]|nr:hypothetical protein [Bacillota bacterium]
VCAGMENADPEAAGAGGRPVLLTLVGLRPPSVSKTAALMNKLFPFFRSHIIDKWTQKSVFFKNPNWLFLFSRIRAIL